MTDDPGTKKCIFKRGVKYPERVKDSSKTAISVMFCGNSVGNLLPCYVVYKAENLWSTWTEGGPKGTRYNRSRSGWFDACCFADWFETVFLPHATKQDGRKILIGDNLSSHFTDTVLQKAREHNISFVCLPANSTHLLQPLDVAFYGPLKQYWRKVIDEWKSGSMKKSMILQKDCFPSLLKKLHSYIYPSDQQTSDNLKAGFKKCGISPLNAEQVLHRLPDWKSTNDPADVDVNVSESLIDMLKDMRGVSSGTEPVRRRRKKITVAPGKSISDDIEIGRNATSADNEESDDDDTRSGSSTDESTASNTDDGADTTVQEDVEDSDDVASSNGSGYTGVTAVKYSNIKVNTWLLVDFAEHSKGTGTRNHKRQLYLGQVVKVLPVGPSKRPSQQQEYEGLFLRQTKSKQNNCFVYPEAEDRCVFSVTQVIGSVEEPSPQRRNVLKFAVDASQWK